MKDYITYQREQEEADRAECFQAVMANPPNGNADEVVVTPPLAPAARETWPKPLQPEAFHGPAGEAVKLVLPHTEADEAGILIQLLLGFGSAVGRSLYLTRGPEYHYANLFLVLVGDTNFGRKGSAWSMALHILRGIDSYWADRCVLSGLSSGEGLIHHVRDAIETEEPIKDKKTNVVTGRHKVMTDRGVEDKRLLVIESEFASVLRNGQRDGNILSTVIRQAWDSGNLRTMTKHSPERATGAHVSLIGHITPTELSKYLVTTDIANGFANRFLWVAVERSKSLPHGGELETVDMAPVLRRLTDALHFARRSSEITMDAEAKELWADVYERLTCARPGMLGSATSRAAPLVLRLAIIYAVLEKSGEIRLPHLSAALEVWRYCEDSARTVFGDSLGDSVADRLLGALRKNRDGLTRKQISVDVFKRNISVQEIERALQVLSKNSLAACAMNGQAEVWSASSVN